MRQRSVELREKLSDEFFGPGGYMRKACHRRQAWRKPVSPVRKVKLRAGPREAAGQEAQEWASIWRARAGTHARPWQASEIVGSWKKLLQVVRARSPAAALQLPRLPMAERARLGRLALRAPGVAERPAPRVPVQRHRGVRADLRVALLHADARPGSWWPSKMGDRAHCARSDARPH
eukprot:6903798-Pyramimonas_sp.AAC.1